MDYSELSREEQNKILRQHGYHWEKITQDWLDDNDDFETRPGWHLYAKDHREVSVTRAFAEIERGVEAVEAEHQAAEQAAEQERKRRQEMKRFKSRIAEIIMKDGIKPDGDNHPEGECVLDTQNIYGGGDWFVIGEDRIWYVRNNGMDGDNWSYNNVRTGGAGAIGWYIPMDTDIEDMLRDLQSDKLPDARRLS